MSERTIENLRQSQKLTNPLRNSMQDVHVVNQDVKEMPNPEMMALAVEEKEVTSANDAEQEQKRETSELLTIGITPVPIESKLSGKVN